MLNKSDESRQLFLVQDVKKVLHFPHLSTKERREIQTGKEKVKLSPFSDDIFLYVEDVKTPPEDS